MPRTTPLRQLYRVLAPVFPTAGQLAVCEFLLNEHYGNSVRHVQRLARLFDDALQSPINTQFDAASHPFKVEGRKNPDKGTNDTYEAINKLPNRTVRATGSRPYEFQYRYREVQILRPENRAARHPAGSAWVDCMGMSSDGSPVLCEIKCETDQTAFYALLQLVTYLSEIATERQQARTRTHLFKELAPGPTRHDLVILLVNPTLRGLKGTLLEKTESLARGFVKQIREHFPGASAVLGNIVCLRATMDKETKQFVGPVETLWSV